MEQPDKITKGDKMKYWIAKTKDGKELSEADGAMWDESQNNIAKLEFNNDGQIISLPENMEAYIQAKTASADLGSKKVQIESRYIAFKLGNNIIKIRVDEKTNNISVEID